MLITLYFHRGNASYQEEKLEEDNKELEHFQALVEAQSPKGGNDHEIYESERAIEHTG
ncbi:hypothetical protein DEO72_LG3g2193 [Vigna unguiculata]|uniref:Uncharacterized protein n=1 Tax=Vigna unguiculata TaxID=3917 RepID=A0A4D6LHL6_VIGUN|nr:hypothetical protein DEO72_LG3g2193 [Vigna unguiculata]